MSAPGSVQQLWRFPVKSMGGTAVEQVRIDRRGVHADRLWAVRDLENDVTASARRVPALLGCTARYAREPGDDAGPGRAPTVIVTFPDGAELDSDDPAIHDRISEVVGREVRLTPLPPVKDTSAHRLSLRQSLANYAASVVRQDFGLSADEALPDTSVFTTKQVLTLARFSTPPGTFVDLSPVHLMSTSSLAALSPDGVPYDVRRFRPNVLVDVAGAVGFPETQWVGSQLRLGTVSLNVDIPTIRCVVPTRAQPGLETDRGLTRQLAQLTDRFLGVYAEVTEAGVVRVGDEVIVHAVAEPGAVRRAASAAGRTALRGLQRVLEATVLRG
ncbi:MOSC N-terminal beta barrel domain-containing protein [Mycobacterium sp. ACS4331]|uniref:MOSC domain-containing protein n=1 Tax=Mycobacterium sp. ACS4331 TaxID=1834121 RepID=UPI0007FD57DE|nr:MOSC N-terminal beta barrel domain-containing protein [Mycobacterium sp. ACS4331]OBF30030.1 hypothetical protein A5727_22790 [Mycobacterium sp. ACS4331]